MISTFPYDDGGAGRLRSIVDVDCYRATVAFCNAAGEWVIADSPFDGPPAPEGLRARLRGLMERNHDKWATYCEIFVRHPWSAEVWTTAACRAACRYKLPNGSDEDVMQGALVSFCELLRAKIDVLAWLRDKVSLEHFERWFRTFVFNLSSAAARNLPVFWQSQPRLNPDSPIDTLLQNIADYRSNASGDRWNKMLAVLARYPMRTKAVVLLRSHGQTWDEVAATLRISVEAARWAVEAYRDELRRDFTCFQ